jgi:pimeloyl-ACP methyl ester carboxylesterase
VSEEVTYTNGGVTLAGTLTLPPGDGPFPAVVLITGSGPEDRDETVFGHKPFWILADHLSRRGVAVLRSDDRGVGGSSGNVNESTTADFAEDALAGVAWLRNHPKISKGRVGILGHSEGGLAAPIAAGRSSEVAFIVLLAGPGVPGAEVLLGQGEALARAFGAAPPLIAQNLDTQRQIFAVIKSEADPAQRRARIADIITSAAKAAGQIVQDQAVAAQIARIETPWFRSFLALDPRLALRQVKVPVLALNGDLDLQVVADQNLPEIEKALKEAGNPDVTVRKLPGLNHLFQPAKSGLPSEYPTNEITLSPEVLALVSDWITARFGKPSG